ncbi:MAG: orotate phosphoribosyltransferase [Gloeomargarita sp. SKYBB_i_bin120]|nr:orotate phosphoribosyltransferase [Gloeomargarita sp. SKYG98]MCS7291642.1 orotate phosphoribosyltransferase [Gloeomargarita sp. SKYB120]MDW8177201.1 orotate phosphoribosyltransferase [Gloeomargarita sp. SKYBB_i_bin120]
MSAALRQELLQLLGRWAYQEGEFLLSSGASSTYYINCKTVTLHPRGAYLVGHLCGALLAPETVAVAGLTLGADPIVTAISVVSAQTPHPVSGLIIRKQPKGHGVGSQIEGPLPPPGSWVTVVEDVVTTGQSLGLAVEVLRAAGYRVEQGITLVDRQQGGAAYLAAKGVALTALFTLPEIQATHRQMTTFVG